jgi:hypothetical protein
MGGAAFRDTHHRCVQMMGIAKSRSTHPAANIYALPQAFLLETAIQIRAFIFLSA